MTHVVILGAGIAGVTAAYAVKAGLGPNDEVTVVSDTPYFHFVPSNPWVATGWRDRSDTAFPIEPCLESRGIRFIHSRVRHILPDLIEVDLENGDVLFYDCLLIATGAAGLTDAIPGLAEYTHSVLHLEQAEKAGAAYREFLQRPGPVVIGAAPRAGGLGALYEYALLVDADLRRRKLRERVPITLVTPEPWPGHLGLGGEGSRGAITAALVDTRISAICNARTVRVDKDAIHVVEVDAKGKEKRTHALPYGYSVYWPALGGAPGIRDAAGLVDERGLVAVDAYLRSPRYPNVFALGACAAKPAGGRTPVPVGAPDSVHAIHRAGETAVHNLLAHLHGEPLVRHVRDRTRWLSDMGTRGAAYLSEPQVSLRDVKWMRQGRWVPQTKLEFAKYFVNKIRLLPASHEPAAAPRIAGVIGRALAGHALDAASSAAGGKPLAIHLAPDSSLGLQALARALGREPGMLAADLLAAAVDDAHAFLGDAGLEALARARRELLVEALPARQPGVGPGAGET